VTNLPFSKDYLAAKTMAILAKTLIIHEKNREMEKPHIELVLLPILPKIFN
jgi:hypothetical protein